jgi:hypothetical protein
MIDSLEEIKHFGMRNFIKQEKERWACSTCGEIICVHKESCIFMAPGGVSLKII